MDHIDMVEKLRERANVSYEEARAALERSNWDMLDALVELEKQGKVHGGASYDTAGAGSSAPKYEKVNATASANDGESGWKNFWDGVKRLFEKSWVNSFRISRKGETLLMMPILVFLLLLICCFYLTLPLLIIGLFFGCRYSFEGRDIRGDELNRVMDKAANVAENVKENIKNAASEEPKKNGDAQ